MAQATLTVWKFDTPEGAAEAALTLGNLARQRILTLHDAATVTWEEGEDEAQDQATRHRRPRPAPSADPSGGCCSA